MFITSGSVGCFRVMYLVDAGILSEHGYMIFFFFFFLINKTEHQNMIVDNTCENE